MITSALLSFNAMSTPKVNVDGVEQGVLGVYSKSGTYSSTGGNITVEDGGQYHQLGEVIIGQNNITTPSTGKITVSGANSLLDIKGNLLLGNSAYGAVSHTEFNITHGATGSIDGMLSLGRGEKDSAVINIDGVGSSLGLLLKNNNLIKVGDEGSGTLNVTNGGKVTTESIDISDDSISNGAVTVDGDNSHVEVKDIIVGNGGLGQLTLTNKGELTVNHGNGNVLIGERVGSSGTVNIGNGGLAGKLNAAEINFGLGTDSKLLFDYIDPEYDFTGKIKGDGVIVKKGSGELSLSGDDSFFKGKTQVNAGKITLTGEHVNGKLGGNVEIGKAGILQASTESLLGNVKDDGELIFSQQNNAAYSQQLSGSGYVSKQGKATLTLVGDNSAFAGHTHVVEGTLQVGDDQGNGMFGGNFSVEKDAILQVSSQSVKGDIQTEGTTIFKQNADGTYKQVLSGQGSIEKNGQGKLVLQGNSQYFLGNTAITNGELVIGDQNHNARLGGDISVSKGAAFESDSNAVNGNIVDDGQVTFDQRSEGHYSGSLSGSGNLVKSGLNTLTLAGDNSAFTGTTTVSQGKLNLSAENGHGELSGNVNVLNGTELEGAGAIAGDVNIYQGASHHPGSPTHLVQVIKGNYTNYGSLKESGQPDEAQHIVVYGDVDVRGATLDLDFSPNNAADWKNITGPMVLIDNVSPNPTIGQFSTINNNMLFLSPQMNYQGGDGNDITLTYTRNDIDFADYAETQNQKNTAKNINALPGDNAVWQSIAFLKNDTLLGYDLDQLSGEIYPAIKSSLVDDTHYIREAMINRLRSLNSEKTSEFNYSAKLSPQEIDNSPVMWSGGYGSWGSNRGSSEVSSQKSRTNGVFLGADIPKSYGRLGMVLGYGTSDLNQEKNHSTASVNTYYLGIYGGHEWDHLALRSGISAGWHSIDSQREINLTSFSDHTSAAYKARTGQVYSELSYKLRALQTDIEPFMSAGYVYEQTDAFKESGHEAALGSTGSSKGVILSNLGLRGDKEFTIATLNSHIFGSAGWQHIYNDQHSVSTMSFADAPESYSVSGTPLASDALKIESGFGIDISQTLNATISYKGTIAAKAKDNGVFGSVNLTF